ncbi:MAG: hypothetical protein HW386_1961 [Gammaproteobacteria bacterium]|nr:hypothetical protein [Gammaproteobacteria bacterium]
MNKLLLILLTLVVNLGAVFAEEPLQIQSGMIEVQCSGIFTSRMMLLGI